MCIQSYRRAEYCFRTNSFLPRYFINSLHCHSGFERGSVLALLQKSNVYISKEQNLSSPCPHPYFSNCYVTSPGQLSNIRSGHPCCSQSPLPHSEAVVLTLWSYMLIITCYTLPGLRWPSLVYKQWGLAGSFPPLPLLPRPTSQSGNKGRYQFFQGCTSSSSSVLPTFCCLAQDETLQDRPKFCLRCRTASKTCFPP